MERVTIDVVACIFMDTLWFMMAVAKGHCRLMDLCNLDNIMVTDGCNTSPDEEVKFDMFPLNRVPQGKTVSRSL